MCGCVYVCNGCIAVVFEQFESILIAFRALPKNPAFRFVYHSVIDQRQPTNTYDTKKQQSIIRRRSTFKA